jgi:hypothetical protein
MMDRIESVGLGLPTYPVGTHPSAPLGEHIMGVVVLAWLTRYPIERWGLDWIRSGTIDLRFRRHLTAGRSLQVHAIADGPMRTMLSVTGDCDVAYSEGWAGVGGERLPPATIDAPESREPVLPNSDSLAGRVLAPIHFSFDAERDLRFAETLSDYPEWQRRGWAHPAWLGSAANALIRMNIDFAQDGQWLHAGLRIDLRAPIRDRARIEMGGRVETLFERGPYRFAACALEAIAEGEPVASMRTTFVYDTISG